jgi:hypothetical protein
MQSGAQMSESLKTVKSILWMLERIKERGEFRYQDWSERFRPEETPMEPRLDRKFHNHLMLFREEALALFKGSKDIELQVEKGRYFLAQRLDHEELERLNDPQSANFLPLLHGLNAHRNLIPFPSEEIERQLVEGFDLNEETLGRVIYKNAFSSRFRPEFINIFLDALHSKTKIFIRPEGGRKPCKVTPLFLVNYEGAWHLLGLNGDLLQYPLSRVLEVKATEVAAEEISPSKLQKLKSEVESTFGINLLADWKTLSSGELITIRYTGKAIRYALERFDKNHWKAGDSWFEVEHRGESVDVRLKVFGTSEAVSEVLRWGADAEALEPDEFRLEWLHQVEWMSRKMTTNDRIRVSSSRVDSNNDEPMRNLK